MPSYRVDFVRALKHLREDYLSLPSPTYIEQGMNGEIYVVHLELDLGNNSPIARRMMSIVGESNPNALKARDKAASEGFKILQRLYNVELHDFRYVRENTRTERVELLNDVNSITMRYEEELQRRYQDMLQHGEYLMNYLSNP